MEDLRNLGERYDIVTIINRYQPPRNALEINGTEYREFDLTEQNILCA